MEVDLCINRALFRAAVASGAYSGIYEAVELRDGDMDRLQGVLKGGADINEIIAPKLLSMDVRELSEIDKSKLLIEARTAPTQSLPFSMAVSRESTAANEMTLYESQLVQQ